MVVEAIMIQTNRFRITNSGETERNGRVWFMARYIYSLGKKSDTRTKSATNEYMELIITFKEITFFLISKANQFFISLI